jgi:hypothetical protein
VIYELLDTPTPTVGYSSSIPAQMMGIVSGGVNPEFDVSMTGTTPFIRGTADIVYTVDENTAVTIETPSGNSIINGDGSIKVTMIYEVLEL